MAYSQLLQYWAFKHTINIGSDYEGGEMLVCRRVLEALNIGLSAAHHEKVLFNIKRLKDDLLFVRNEIDAMHMQGKLTEFLQSNIIKSINDLSTNIKEAYSCALTAGEKQNEDMNLASQNIHHCHDCIQRALADIVICRQ